MLAPTFVPKLPHQINDYGGSKVTLAAHMKGTFDALGDFLIRRLFLVPYLICFLILCKSWSALSTAGFQGKLREKLKTMLPLE